MSWSYSVTTDALDVLCAQLMRNLFATAKFLVSFARYSDLLVENRTIFIPHLYLAPRRVLLRRNFANVFDTHKTRMIGLPCDEEIMTIC